jgi:hypothetical protein
VRALRQDIVAANPPQRAWFQQLTSATTKASYPNLIAVRPLLERGRPLTTTQVNWFEFLKDEAGVDADFRALTGMPRCVRVRRRDPCSVAPTACATR